MKYYVELRDDLEHLPCGKLVPIQKNSICIRHRGKDESLSIHGIQDKTGYVLDFTSA